MRFGCGCLLIVIAVAVMLVFVVVPVLPPLAENRTVDRYLGAVLCQPNESLIREQYSWRDRDGISYSMDVFCMNAREQVEDVTGKWILYGIVGFTVPFLMGLFALIVGTRRLAMRSVSRIAGMSGVSVNPQAGTWGYSGVPGVVDVGDGVLRVGGVEIKTQGISPDQVALYQQTASAMNDSDLSLTAKLQQIQDARDSGLITDEEYNRLRQAILDNMD